MADDKDRAGLVVIQENERRYIVHEIDPSIFQAPSLRIRQAYFETQGPDTVRVRLTDDVRAEITHKTGTGESRLESTAQVNMTAGQLLYDRVCVDRLAKTRYQLDGWEVDVFEPPLAGLIIAEFERPTAGGPLELPPWIGRATDVTETLTNRHLARLASDLSADDDAVPLELLLAPKVRPPTIVVTGGPGSGKSQIMADLRGLDLGRQMHFVPEVASIIISQVGAKPPPPDDKMGYRTFQRIIRRTQIGFEEISALDAARNRRRAILLDRGTVDGAAYFAGGLTEFEEVCRTTAKAEYSRYDLVICLDTPPRDIYEAICRNNPARSESYDEAAALVVKIMVAWAGHPNAHFIPNGRDWPEKRDMVIAEIERFLKTR